MRLAQDRMFGMAQDRGAATGANLGSSGGGWFQVAETMGRGRNDDRTPTEQTGPATTLRASQVRLERVMELRAAIASGSYRVSAADVADRLVARLMIGGAIPGRG